MPRIRQNQERYADADLLQEIRTGQGSADLMNTKALADASGLPYQILLRRLKTPENMTLGELRKLIQAIPIRPAAVLRYLGYRKKDMDNLETI